MGILNKSNQSINLKSLDIDTSQTTDEQEKIFDKELLSTKDLSKENSSNKKENDNDNLNQSNSKEKLPWFGKKISSGSTSF